MTAKLGTVGEYVYLLDKLLYPVVLDSLCEPGPSCCANGLEEFSELDCEENKLELRLFGKQYYYIPPPLTVHFPMTRSVRYQPILHTLYYTLHTEHVYCLSYRFLNNVVTTTVIEMVEMVEILNGRLGKRSVERVRYVINNLLHLVIVKYGVISLVLCISTRLRLVTILTLLVKYLVIFHADPCNMSYVSYTKIDGK